MMSGKKPPAPPTPPTNDGAPVINDDMTKLLVAYDALKQEADRMKDMAARSQADLQNAKERLERERQDVAKFALEGMLRKLLPTVDNFQRAFLHLPEELKNHEWVKGITSLEQEFVKTVTDMGLAKMECLGQAVDPEKHEVLMTGPGEAGKVIEVFEDGYMLNGRVLRVAKVRVGNSPSDQ